MKALQNILFLFCAPLVLAAAVAAAQSGDIRISPPDPLLSPVPDSVRIQSAATIGGRTLVAWGTMIPNGNATPVSALMMQMVEANTPIGDPVRITGENESPNGVAVVALEDRFLVLINVYSSLFRMVVGMDGTILAAPEWMGGPAAASERDVWLYRDANGYVLSWRHVGRNAEQANLSRRRIDASCALIGEAESVVGPYDYAYIYPTLPGVVFDVDRYGSYTMRFLDRRGRDSRSGDAVRLLGPHFVDADTSLVALFRSGGAPAGIHFFGNVFDAAPAWSVPLPAVLPENVIAGAGMIRKLDAGRYEVTYAVADPARHDAADTVVRFMRAVLRSDGTFDTPVLLHAVLNNDGEYCAPLDIGSALSITGAHVIGNDNTVRVMLEFQGIGTGGLKSVCSHYFFFAPDGRMFESDGLQSLMGPGNLRRRGDVARVENDTLSQVRVELAGGGLLLSAPVAGLAGVPHQCRPALALRDGRFIVAWEQLDPPATLVLGETDLLGSDSLRPIDSIVLVKPNFTGKPRDWYEGVEGRVVPAENAVLIDRRYLNGGGLRDVMLPNREESLQYGLPEGGRRLAGIDKYANDPYGGWCVLRDPDSDQLVASQHNSSFTEVYAFDHDGNRLWRDSLGGERLDGMVPIAPNEFYLYNSRRCDTLFRYRNGVQVGRIYLSPLVYTQMGRFHRLRGNRFLRVHALRPMTDVPLNGSYAPGDYPRSNRLPLVNASLVVFELYDTDGKPLAADTMEVPTRYYDFAITQAPRDSSILIVWGSDTGIRLTVLEPDLRIRERDILVSHTERKAVEPAIVMDDTTLHMVWADYRTPGADIYGTSWTVPERLRGVPAPPVPEAPGGIVIGSIGPVPALDHARVLFELPAAGRLSAELIDASGRRVRLEDRGGMPAGPGRLDLDLRGLPPGVYTVILSMPDRKRASGRMIVVK